MQEYPTFCSDCAWRRNNSCAVITDPTYFVRKSMECFAKANVHQAEIIEQQIQEYKRHYGGVR